MYGALAKIRMVNWESKARKMYYSRVISLTECLKQVQAQAGSQVAVIILVW